MLAPAAFFTSKSERQKTRFENVDHCFIWKRGRHSESSFDLTRTKYAAPMLVSATSLFMIQKIGNEIMLSPKMLSLQRLVFATPDYPFNGTLKL